MNGSRSCSGSSGSRGSSGSSCSSGGRGRRGDGTIVVALLRVAAEIVEGVGNVGVMIKFNSLRQDKFGPEPAFLSHVRRKMHERPGSGTCLSSKASRAKSSPKLANAQFSQTQTHMERDDMPHAGARGPDPESSTHTCMYTYI